MPTILSNRFSYLPTTILTVLQPLQFSTSSPASITHKHEFTESFIKSHSSPDYQNIVLEENGLTRIENCVTVKFGWYRNFIPDKKVITVQKLHNCYKNFIPVTQESLSKSCFPGGFRHLFMNVTEKKFNAMRIFEMFSNCGSYWSGFCNKRDIQTVAQPELVLRLGTSKIEEKSSPKESDIPHLINRRSIQRMQSHISAIMLPLVNLITLSTRYWINDHSFLILLSSFCVHQSICFKRGSGEGEVIRVKQHCVGCR